MNGWEHFVSVNFIWNLIALSLDSHKSNDHCVLFVYLIQLIHQFNQQTVDGRHWLLAHVYDYQILQLFNELVSLLGRQLQRELVSALVIGLLDNLAKDSIILHSAKLLI